MRSLRNQIVFDRKKGLIGLKRLAGKNEEKEFGTNYVVDVLDPINFNRIETVRAFGGSEHNWYPLPRDDPRVRFWNLFDIIEGGDADWYYNGYHNGDGIFVEEAFIENKHEIFEQVRKLFEPPKRDC